MVLPLTGRLALPSASVVRFDSTPLALILIEASAIAFPSPSVRVATTAVPSSEIVNSRFAGTSNTLMNPLDLIGA